MSPQGGQLPPEVLQDQLFMQFMQEAMGCQFDPNSGSFIDMQSGQPIPPDAIMQAYQAFQQQMQAQGMQPQGAPEGQAADAGMGMDAGAMAPAEGEQPQVGGDMLQQLQKMVETSIETYTAQLDKKLETLIDKLDTVKMALEEIRGTDDKRDEAAKNEEQAMRDEIAADLQPTEKVASVQPAAPVVKPKKAQRNTTPGNIFDLIMNKH